MEPEVVRELYAYGRWAGARIFDAAARLTPAQFTATEGIQDAGRGSIRDTLRQVVGAQVGWVSWLSGRTVDVRVWELLVHVANHGTQHRSEAAALLTAFGASPGDLDFLFYLIARGAPAAG